MSARKLRCLELDLVSPKCRSVAPTRRWGMVRVPSSTSAVGALSSLLTGVRSWGIQVAGSRRAPTLRAGLLLGSVVVIGSWWVAARLILGEYRPELVGARFSSDLERPVAWLVQAGIGFVILGAVSALLLAFLVQATLDDRRLAAAVLGATGVVLVVWSGLTMPATSCAFDSYSGVTAKCASGTAGFATDALMVAIPTAVVIGILLAGVRRSPRDRVEIPSIP